MILSGLLGGVLIGLASGALLLLNGRIAGISGIYGGLLQPKAGDWGWRLWFLGGLLTGGLLLLLIAPSRLPLHYTVSGTEGWATLIVAGLLVGFGTRLGSGCTSGHGVCGVSRLSPRSIIATATFVLFGMATVFLSQYFLGA